MKLQSTSKSGHQLYVNLVTTLLPQAIESVTPLLRFLSRQRQGRLVITTIESRSLAEQIKTLIVSDSLRLHIASCQSLAMSEIQRLTFNGNGYQMPQHIGCVDQIIITTDLTKKTT